MDERAAKGIAANIRTIVQATVCYELWCQEGKGEQMWGEYDTAIKQAEGNIAQWLMQPMITKEFHLTKDMAAKLAEPLD